VSQTKKPTDFGVGGESEQIKIDWGGRKGGKKRRDGLKKKRGRHTPAEGKRSRFDGRAILKTL